MVGFSPIWASCLRTAVPIAQDNHRGKRKGFFFVVRLARSHYGWAIVLLSLLLSAFSSIPPAHAAPNSPDDLLMPRYFPETGFWVEGVFRQYWETHGGLYVHGYPISAVFQQDGYWRQYFERSVFEYHPELAGTPYAVLLVRVGAWRVSNRTQEPPFQPVSAFQSSSDHWYFPETQHSLNYGFKAFWIDHGGLPNFGYPLSEEFDEKNPDPPAGDGKVHTVQYFERARFEYHPENRGTPWEVELGLLGREYLQARGAPPEAVQRQNPNLPPPDPITGRLYGPHLGYGFNIAWRGDDGGAAYNQKALDMVKQAGFGWVRIQVHWATLEPSPGQYQPQSLDLIVNQANQNGVNILVSIVHAPSWADPNGGIPQDPTAFGALMQYLAQRYKGKVQAWEIWNEQNLAIETGGHVDLVRYIKLLEAGYRGVKASDPQAIVVFGGLSPTGVMDPSLGIDDREYLKQAYAYNNGEIKQYFDVLGVHPGSNNNPPDAMWPDHPGPGPGWRDHPSFYFRRAEQLRQVMLDNGDGAKQVWLTEFGWTTANQAPGFEYGNQISESDQAQYLVRAFEIARTEWPWVGVMFVWNLNFSTMTQPSDEKYPWSVLYADWSPRPSYLALKNMPK